MVRDMMMRRATTYSSSSGGEREREEEEMNVNAMKPAWLERLMAETFFGGCGVHQDRRKNEKNVFCLHCCSTICPHCLPSHRSHPLLQVRRYVYHDVVRLGDLEKLIDCSNIQPYTINGAKVIFLNQRPQSRSCKGSANVCCTCDRILQEPFHFCSLACKVDHMVYEGENLSGILHRFDESDFAFSQFEGLRVDGGSEVIDEDTQIAPPDDFRPSSCSNMEATSNSVISCEPNKHKNKSNAFLPRIVLSLGSRRKGAPQRAPLS
ncbi:tRNA-intron endonuclease [Senna tora]|uniref:tRNA-intron endonuclease n=1 Tax=Senna tora TaxID=362788 RepID=A0A834SF35_9FABA|nr:tRNA-intron endonuclease [Senna tora]